MPENRYLLTNAQIVTPDRVIAGGTIAVEGERIVEVSERTFPAAPDVADLGGRYVLPGLIDLHADNIEREVAPRAGADLDPAYALSVYDRKLAAAGVTTQFHGIYFANKAGFGRSVEHGVEMALALDDFRAAPHRLVEHNILHRLDAHRLQCGKCCLCFGTGHHAGRFVGSCGDKSGAQTRRRTLRAGRRTGSIRRVASR